MNLFGHLAVAAAGFAVAIDLDSVSMTDISVYALPFFATMLGALLPDIDVPTSTLGRRIQPISNLLEVCLGHRGLTHSLLAIGLLWYLADYLQITLLYWLIFGYALHLVGDMLTPSGVPLLWPLSRRSRFFFTLPANRIGEPILVALVVFASAMIIQYR